MAFNITVITLEQKVLETFSTNLFVQFSIGSSLNFSIYTGNIVLAIRLASGNTLCNTDMWQGLIMNDSNDAVYKNITSSLIVLTVQCLSL